jgi:hypothetical protein
MSSCVGAVRHDVAVAEIPTDDEFSPEAPRDDAPGLDGDAEAQLAAPTSSDTSGLTRDERTAPRPDKQLVWRNGDAARHAALPAAQLAATAAARSNALTANLRIVSAMPKIDFSGLLGIQAFASTYQKQFAAVLAQWNSASRVWTEALASQIRTPVLELFSSPGWHQIIASLRDLNTPNWIGHDIDPFAVWDVAVSDGIALVWVPRGELVVQLLEAEGQEARWALLADRAADIVSDCRQVAASVEHTRLAEYRERLDETIRAHEDGHVRPAQALAAVVFTSLLQYAYGHGKLVNVPRSKWRSKVRDETTLARYRAAVLIEAAVAVVASVGDLVPEDKWPKGFNRHLTLHRVSRRQYSEAHAVAAVMLATALLAETQSLLNRGMLELAELDVPSTA